MLELRWSSRASLVDDYRKLIDDHGYSVIVTAARAIAQPKFITVHPRPDRPIRVHHVLVQLPGG